MELVTVDSSMIYAVGYDAGAEELTVVFKNGRTYCYEEVPADVHEALLVAESKGQFMRAEIIDMYQVCPIGGRRRRR